MASKKHSFTSPEQITILGNSPCEAFRANFRSPCSVLVGIPVDGPPLEYNVITTGTSLIPAHPIPSTINENPGPEVDVPALAPVSAAPVAIVIAAISSSVWTTSMEPLPPETLKYSCASKNSLSSEAGVMG